MDTDMGRYERLAAHARQLVATASGATTLLGALSESACCDPATSHALDLVCAQLDHEHATVLEDLRMLGAHD